jgi:hypothetical protein
VLGRRRAAATLDDVVEYLKGIGTILMEISAQLTIITERIDGENDEEADS